MTAGPTGVVWAGRTAEINSGRLIAGVGPAPLGAASAAWGAISAAHGEVAAIVSKVVVDLAPAWIGGAAASASGNLVAFGTHVQRDAMTAADVASRAGGQMTAYSTAVLAMPTLIEIAAAEAAKVAAVAAGPAAPGAVAAAEAADRALDVRAALAMEGYEAASAHLAAQTTFGSPPPVSTDSASASATVDPVNGRVQDVSFAGGGEATGGGIPASTVAAAAEGAAAAAATAVRVGSAVAGGVVGAVSQVGAAAGQAISAVGGTAAGGTGAMGAMGAGAAGLGAGGSAGGSVTRPSTRNRPASVAASAAAGGAGAAAAPMTSATPGSAAVWGAAEVPRVGGESAAAAAAAPIRSGSGAPIGAMPRTGGDDDDTEHRPVRHAGYLEQLPVAGQVAPAVIGADPDAGHE